MSVSEDIALIRSAVACGLGPWECACPTGECKRAESALAALGRLEQQVGEVNEPGTRVRRGADGVGTTTSAGDDPERAPGLGIPGSLTSSDAERILYAVIDGEAGFGSVEDVRAFIVNEWQASKSEKRESAQSALVVEAGDWFSPRNDYGRSPCFAMCGDDICRDHGCKHVYVSTTSTTDGPGPSPDSVSEVVARLEKERDGLKAMLGERQKPLVVEAGEGG